MYTILDRKFLKCRTDRKLQIHRLETINVKCIYWTVSFKYIVETVNFKYRDHINFSQTRTKYLLTIEALFIYIYILTDCMRDGYG